jgi:hypothetical protein
MYSSYINSECIFISFVYTIFWGESNAKNALLFSTAQKRHVQHLEKGLKHNKQHIRIYDNTFAWKK